MPDDTARSLPNVRTCPPETDLLEVLAQEIIAGTLIPDAAGVPLFRWRIFLPTRRAARRLQRLFFEKSGRGSVALPQIRPVGDIDEDELAPQEPAAAIPEAISAQGLLFEVIHLLGKWAAANPQFAIARDISGAMGRVQQLAQSLIDLLMQAETEERALDGIDAVYGLDLAGHREAILDLLSVLKISLPQRLMEQDLISPARRRNLLIRAQATNIRSRPGAQPAVIAGSTGTNPATRDLIAAIAHDPLGLAVLPGLDLAMDDASWLALAQTPTHPQYNLKLLLDELGLSRELVQPFGTERPSRSLLVSEFMRPAETTGQWHTGVARRAETYRAALAGVSLMEAPDRHVEARSIALALRHALHEGKTGIALVTPDRDLSWRVKAELRRWNIEADDTRGAALTERGAAQMLHLICDAAVAGFAPLNLVALLHGSLCDFGMDSETYRQSLEALERLVMRQQGMAKGLNGLRNAVARAGAARQAARAQGREAGSDAEWELALALAARIGSVLQALETGWPKPLGDHIADLLAVLEAMAPRAKAEGRAADALFTALEQMALDGHRLQSMTLVDAVPLIFARLDAITVRAPEQNLSPIAIYGLLEARLMRFDTVVLGGLNEGVWPAAPDPGPWLNRPMRDAFHLQQPERDIGLTAHDFAAGFAQNRVIISWSNRIGGAPAMPSRWVLRLRTVMEAAGIAATTHCDPTYVNLALRLDRTDLFRPWPKPLPAPPIDARPRKLSVTGIETLIRDPYAVYARRVLKLEPLRAIGEDADARLRGTLFHAALAAWNEASVHAGKPASVAVLLEEGRKAFAPFSGDAEVMGFWWPRFVRMARWMADVEPALRMEATAILPEVEGAIAFPVKGEEFKLTAIADRIDVLTDGGARIIDYKSGEPPTSKQVGSGFNPQLTLEAAMLARGGFAKVGAMTAREACYIHISGGRRSKGILAVGQGEDSGSFAVAEKAEEHWQGLLRRIALLLTPGTAFPPRAFMEKEDEVSDYDHLSRLREWRLG